MVFSVYHCITDTTGSGALFGAAIPHGGRPSGLCEKATILPRPACAFGTAIIMDHVLPGRCRCLIGLDRTDSRLFLLEAVLYRKRGLIVLISWFKKAVNLRYRAK
jgi:hypothetical protein